MMILVDRQSLIFFLLRLAQINIYVATSKKVGISKLYTRERRITNRLKEQP